MKTHTLKRYLAAALALVMLLPLISVPTFAEEGNVLWSVDFENATSVGDVFTKWGVSGALTLTNSATDENNRVVEMPYQPMAPAEYYYTSNKWKSVHPVITVTSISGDTLTGTFTADGKEYSVSGTINRENFATATTATATDGSGATLSEYIVTGEVLDSRQGIGNVAVPKTFKHSAWNYNDVDNYVLSMDIYIPSGAQGVFAVQVEGKVVDSGTTFAAQPFFITASKTAAYLEKSGNCSYSGNGAVSFTLGQWNTVTTIIDKDTGEYTVYLNNQYAFKAKGSGTGYFNLFPNAPISLNANSLIFQVNRGYNVSYYAGSVQVDNVKMAKNTDGMNLSIFSQDFSKVSATSEILSSGAHGVSIADSATEAGNKVFQFESKGYAPAKYYLYISNNNKAALTNVVESTVGGNLTVTGDATVNNLTYNVTGVVNTKDTTTTATVNSCSGTAAGTVYIVTGELADAKGGFLGNVAVPNYFKHPTWNNEDVSDFVIETDIYMAPGTKGTFATQINATVVEGGASRSIQPYVITSSNGTTATLNINTNQTIISGSKYTLETGKWYKLTVVIDKQTSETSVFVDGIFAFSCKNSSSSNPSYSLINAPVNLKANSYMIQINRGALPAALAGYVQVDNIVFRDSIEGLGLKYYSQNFGAYASKIGQSVNIGDSIQSTATFERDPLNSANTVVKVPLTAKPDNTEILMLMNGSVPTEHKDGQFGYAVVTRNAQTNAVEVSGYTVTANANGTYNITNGTNTYNNLVLDVMSTYRAYWGGDGAMDQNWAMNHPQIAYNTEQKVILAADYYISTGAVGSFFGQLRNYQLNGVSKNWLELYVVNCETGVVRLGSASKTVARQGQWNHFELTINLVSGDAELVVNGETVGSKNLGANLTVNASRWSFCKLLRKQGNYKQLDGYVLVDNIEMLTATANNQVVTVDPENLLYVNVNGQKIYDNTFYITEGTPYTPVYLDVAKYASMLVTEDKNSVRLSKEAGLRFATKVNVTLLDELFALIDTGDVLDIEFGHLIAPEELITTELTKAAMDKAGMPYLNVRATYGKYYLFDDDTATTHFVGSIVDLYETNVARDFAGRGYITLNLKSGSTVDLYSSFTQIANVKDVATRALPLGGYTDAEVEILNQFIAGKAPEPSENGLAVRAMMGLNVLAIGDSLFNGHSLSESDTWIAKMAQTYHWNLTNLGCDGWTVAKNDAAYSDPSKIRSSMYDYLMTDATYCYGGSRASYTYGNPASVANDAVDLILLEGGTNDKGWGIPLGNIDSETDLAKGDNYLGALNQMIIKLKVMYPNAKIALVTSWHGLSTSNYTVDGMKALKNTVYANDARVVLVDAGNPELNGGVKMADAAFRAEYACTASDANHLNEKGMKIMAENMHLLLYRTVFAQ